MPYMTPLEMILAQMRGQAPGRLFEDDLLMQSAPPPALAPSAGSWPSPVRAPAPSDAPSSGVWPPSPRQIGESIGNLLRPLPSAPPSSRPFMPYAPDDSPSLADLLRDTTPPTTPLRSPFEGGAGLASAPAMTGFDPLNASRVTDSRRFVTTRLGDRYTALPDGRIIMGQHLSSDAPRGPGGADPLGNMPTTTHYPAQAPRDYRFPDPLSQSRQVPNPAYLPELARGNVTALPDAPGPAEVMGRALPQILPPGFVGGNPTARVPMTTDSAGRALASYTPPRAQPATEPPLPPVDPRLVAALAQNPNMVGPPLPPDAGWIRMIRGDGRGPGGDVTNWYGDQSQQPGPRPGMTWEQMAQNQGPRITTPQQLFEQMANSGGLQDRAMATDLARNLNTQLSRDEQIYYQNEARWIAERDRLAAGLVQRGVPLELATTRAAAELGPRPQPPASLQAQPPAQGAPTQGQVQVPAQTPQTQAPRTAPRLSANGVELSPIAAIQTVLESIRAPQTGMNGAQLRQFIETAQATQPELLRHYLPETMQFLMSQPQFQEWWQFRHLMAGPESNRETARRALWEALAQQIPALAAPGADSAQMPGRSLAALPFPGMMYYYNPLPINIAEQLRQRREQFNRP